MVRRRFTERSRQARLGITPAPLPEGFLSIRDLFEADILRTRGGRGEHSRIERNTVKTRARAPGSSGGRERVKEEVYAITGAGGGLLLLTLLVSLLIVRRYRQKLLGSSGDSATFRRNSMDFSPSFQHNADTEDNNSLHKIYSLVKAKEAGAGAGQEAWLNPMAKLGSEAGSQASRVTRRTEVEASDSEDRARSAGTVINVETDMVKVDIYIVTPKTY